MAPEVVTGFEASEETTRWVIPREGSKAAYLYMRKVYAGEKMVYILTVSVSAEAMNRFLFFPSEGREKEWRENSRWLVVNDSKYSLGDLSGDGSLDNLAEEPDRRVVKIRAELDGFPQSVLVITDIYVQRYWIYAVFFLVILLVLGLVWNEVEFIRKIFAQISSCMKGFEASVAGGFEGKLTVHGNNEISRIEEAFNVQIDKIQELIQLTRKQVELVKDSQLMALQHQINPHFLYNTLETFSYLMERHGHYEEADAIVAFSRMMRYNTMKSSNGYATIDQELTQVNHYLSIPKLKNQELNFQTEIPKELYESEILRFLLQPLIENCVQHGYCGHAMDILLKCQVQGDYLYFEVFDSGCGMSQERVKEINHSLREQKNRDKIGIGLSNIHDRLCLFYSKECGLHVESREGQWTRICFSVPFRFRERDDGDHWEELRREAFISGANDYMLKPVAIQELEKKMALYLSREDREEVAPRQDKDRTLPKEVMGHAVEDRSIAYAIRYIYDNYRDKSLTMEDVARHVSFNYGHFSSLFRKETGMTFPSFLRKVRVEKAMELLEDPFLKISDICYQVGYKYPQQFSTNLSG